MSGPTRTATDDQQVQPLPRGESPFDTSGIERDAAGIAHYTGLPASLVAMLRDSVAANPDGEALVEVGGRRLTYTELWDASARVAGGLVAAGVQRGDRVANLLPAGVDWVLGFLGTQLAGAVAVPVNTRFAEPEIEYVLTDSGSEVVLRPGEPLPDGDPHAVDDLAPGDLAAIFYTSGTTGFPKGAMTSHENFLSNVETALRVVDIDRAEGPDSRSLVSVPLFHVTGCNSQLLVQLALRGTTVVLPVFGVAAFLRTVVEERINSLTSVPAIYALALAQSDFGAHDVGAVTRLSYGGAPMAPALIGRITDGFPNARLGNGFGLTETSSITTYLPHEWAAEHPDSVGFAAPVVDLALDEVDPESGVGELLIRGPNVVLGYWNKPDATDEVMEDGWFLTGDMAKVDEDGYFFIVDRKKELIIRGGYNVYPREIEEVLYEHPAVSEVAVIGVADDALGEEVAAMVVLKAGAEASEDDIRAYAKERVAAYKYPRKVWFSDELPKGPTGKILKREIKPPE